MDNFCNQEIMLYSFVSISVYKNNAVSGKLFPPASAAGDD
ncbi:hypothetical protein WCP94_001793 [Bilophila wadsworthia]